MCSSKYIGKQVRIRKEGYYGKRRLHLTGTIGVVCSFWNTDNLGVKIEGLTNETSKYGYFYFKFTELEFIDSKNNKTKIDEGEIKMSKIENYVNVAMVQFMDGNNPNTYEYANFQPDLAIGDACVVMTAHHGLSLARVVDLKPRTEAALYREIVAKFDTSAYEERVKQREKAAELKAKMNERAKQLQDIGLYQLLAKEDATMAQLLDEYMKAANA